MDLSRLEILYAGVWTLAFAATALIKIPSSADVTTQLIWLVFGTSGTFIILAVIARASTPAASVRAPSISAMDAAILNSFVRLLFWIWLPLYLAAIAYSGGIPIVWRLLGDPRTYIDFGAPSISGLLNMLRSFMVAALMYQVLERRANRRDWLLLLVLFGSAFAEMSRGALSVLMFYSIGCYVLLRRVSLGVLVRLALLACLFVFGFGLIGQTRTIDYELDLEAVFGQQAELTGIPIGLIWVYLYLATPLNNVAAALAQGLEPPMLPYFTLQPLLPTVVRSQFFEANDYPVDLPVEAFNATTFFAPLIADFGVGGAFVFAVAVQAAAVYVQVRVRTGSLIAMLMYPTVFTSIALSIFYIYFLSLPFVLYPLLALGFEKYRRSKLAAIAAGDLRLRKRS